MDKVNKREAQNKPEKIPMIKKSSPFKRPEKQSSILINICKDKNKQTWGIRSGEWGMKEQTKIKIKDEATYLGKRNQYHNSSKCSKKTQMKKG